MIIGSYAINTHISDDDCDLQIMMNLSIVQFSYCTFHFPFCMCMFIWRLSLTSVMFIIFLGQRCTYDLLYSSVPPWISYDWDLSLTLVTNPLSHVFLCKICAITGGPVWRSSFAFWSLCFFRGWLSLSSLDICPLLARLLIGSIVQDCFQKRNYIGLSSVADNSVFLWVGVS